MRTVYLGPIYPIKLKPASAICTWADWPDDVRDTLRRWNSGHLSFVKSGIFKCMRCEEFCRPQPYGTCKLDGDFFCDDCMIALAREGHVPQGRGREGQGWSYWHRPGGPYRDSPSEEASA